MSRPLSIALLSALLAAVFGGACGSSSTAKPDGGGNDATVGDHVTTSNLLVGTISSDGPPPCLTEPLLLVGGQAQCTVVEHRMATARRDRHGHPLLRHRQPGPLLVAGHQPQHLPRWRVDVHVRSRPGKSESEPEHDLVRLQLPAPQQLSRLKGSCRRSARRSRSSAKVVCGARRRPPCVRRAPPWPPIRAPRRARIPPPSRRRRPR